VASEANVGAACGILENMRFTPYCLSDKKLDGAASARLRRNGIKNGFCKGLSRRMRYFTSWNKVQCQRVRKSFMIERISVFANFDGTAFDWEKVFLEVAEWLHWFRDKPCYFSGICESHA